jgi:hypothetical protein
MNAEQPLARFERLARRLVEGTFRSLFGGPLAPLDLGPRLARAVEDGSRDGRAPNRFEVRLYPGDYDAIMQAYPDVAVELAAFVQSLVPQLGLVLAQRPEMLILADAGLHRREVRVETFHGSDTADTTQMRPHPRLDSREALRERDAFLIVDGRRHVALRKPVVSLGRHADNDVVINNSNVSRRHAQVRWRYGRFVVYDLSSRGGTRVNGQLVRECVLHPGDVILLSTIPVIYGEGARETPQGGDTLVRVNGQEHGGEG